MSRFLRQRGGWGSTLVVMFAWLVAALALHQDSQRTTAAPGAGDAVAERSRAVSEAPALALASSEGDEQIAMADRLARYQEVARQVERMHIRDDADASSGSPIQEVAENAQPAPTQPVPTQPATVVPAAGDAPPPAAAQPSNADQPADLVGPPFGRQPTIEERLRAARASTQRSTPPPDFVGPVPDDGSGEGDEEWRSARSNPATFVGPPYRPAERARAERLAREAEARRAREAGNGEGRANGGAANEEGAQVAQTPPNPNEPSEWFNFEGMPWEDVVKIFAERLGKPLMQEDDLVLGGQLTYKNPRKFTQSEAMDELNLLLHEKGYRFVEREHHIYVLPLSEMPMSVPVERTYNSVEEFEQASLRDMDYATVYIDVKDQPAKQVVDMFSDSLPDDARISVVGDTNRIKLVSVARDVRKFLALKQLVTTEQFDPRETRIFSIKTNATDIERMVRELLDLGQRQMRYNPQTRRMEPVQGEGESVRILADERKNTLIVKGTQDELKRVDEFIKKIDEKPDIGEFNTHVIEVQHGNAVDIAQLLNDIFQQEQGSQAPRFRQIQQQQPGRRTPPPQQAGQQASPQDIVVEDVVERAKKTIRLVADERTNSLIVYANKDGLERVHEMLEVIDKPVPSNFRTFELQHARAEEVQPLVDQMVRGATAAPGRGRTARSGPTVIADATHNALHVIADRESMDQIERIIVELDIEAPPEIRHVVELVNLTPSRVAEMIRPLLDEAGGGASAARPARRGGGAARTPRASATARIIPLDEAQTLIVYCAPEEWEKVDQTIQLWDQKALTNTPQIRSFEVKQGSAESIATTVGNLYRRYEHPTLGASPVFVDQIGDTIYVQAVRPALEEIASLVSTMDVAPDVDPMVILPLQHADATQVAELARPILEQAGGAARGRGARGVGPSIQAEPLTNSLIVRADRSTLEQVKAFARQMDEQMNAAAPDRRFYVIKNARPGDVATAITQLMARQTGRRGSGGAGSQINAVVAGNQVVVDAPADKQAEIARLVEEIDNPAGGEVVIKTINLPGADVGSIANRLNAAFREKVQRSGLVARFDADPSTETVLLTLSADLIPEADRLLKEYEEISKGLITDIQFRQLQHASADEAARWLKEQLIATITRQYGRAEAQAVSVTPDVRTNRVIINGPQVAVKQGMLLLDQFDVPPQELADVNLVTIETRKLPGLDVNSLANNLNQIIAAQPPRPDKLKIAFRADPLTETLIFSTPKDKVRDLDELIAKFAAETTDLTTEQKFIQIRNADSQYIADQVRALLDARVSSKRGRDVASRISVSVDSRLNRVVLNAPKFAIEMAEALVKELDQVATAADTIRTIPLANADANAVNQIIQQVFQDKIRTKRTLRIAVEPLSNALIVSGGKEDFEEIERWAKDVDQRAISSRAETRIIEIKNANAWEVLQVLNQTYTAKRPGQQQKLGTEIAFSVIASSILVVQAPADKLSDIETMVAKLDSSVSESSLPTVTYTLKYADPGEVSNMINGIFGSGRRGQRSRETQEVQVTVTNGTLVVRAPQAQQKEIAELIAKVDSEDKSNLQIKLYELKILNATQVAVQVQLFLRSAGMNTRRGQMQPGAFPEPTTNTLVVMAPAEQIPFIDNLINQIEQGQKLPESDPRPYALTNVRADQIARSVESMLKAKITERAGSARANTIPAIVLPESATNRLLIYTPDEYQELAAQLVRMIDQDVDTGEIVHILHLEQADAVQMANSLMQTIRGGTRGGQPTWQVVVSADAGSNSILLSGLPKDVAAVEKMITELEGNSTAIPELQIFRLEYASTMDVTDALESIFPANVRNPSESVTITADDYYNRLIVTANKRKMRQVEGFIKELDKAPPTDGGTFAGGREMYFVDIFRGDADDIAWDVEGLLPDEDAGGPTIEADWFGEYIKVVCRPSEFPRIESLIREFEKRAKVETKYVLRKGKELERILPLLQAQHANLVVEQSNEPRKGTDTIVEDLWPEGSEPPRQKKRNDARSEREGAARPVRDEPVRTRPEDVQPFMTSLRPGDERIDALIDEALPAGADDDAPEQDVSRAAQDSAGAARPRAATSQPKPAAPLSGLPPEPPQRREPVKVQVLPDGRVAITGPEGSVKEIEDAMDLLEEDLALGEVIRIFRFRYGDVNAAAQILDRMFNDRQQMIRMLQPQQQEQQQQQQGREGRGGAEGGQGGRGPGGAQVGPGAGLMQQMQQMMGGARSGRGGAQAAGGGQSVRIATDAAHSYLIVKCDESELPEIRELLRELDVPPGEVDVRVYQLKHIDAQETANNIKEVLGISRARSGRPQLPAAGGGANQQQMLQILQQQMMVQLSGVDGEGARIESVEIVPNSVTNSLMVSAPPEVMKIIEKVINDLEELETSNVTVIRYYELRKSRVDDIVPLLQEIFDSAAGGVRRGGGGGGLGAGSRTAGSPANLGQVSISGDPRTNMVIYTAEMKDLPIIEAQIKLLDVGGADVETYVVQYGDAETIASTVEAIFAASGGGGGGARDGRRGGAQASGLALRLSSEPMTNTILVYGPEEERVRALDKIEELDRLSRNDIREIPVVNADPQALAEKLMQLFGGTSATPAAAGGPGGARRGGRTPAQATGRVVVMGDKSANKLLVRAPDRIFDEMLSLVKMLDQPDLQLQIKTFALRHARAEVVVEALKGAMLEYMQLAGMRAGSDLPFDPFTAVPDPRTNSVMVVGSAETFAFVAQVLSAVDVETPDDQQKEFRSYVLDRVAATTVADAINNFAAGGAGGGTAAAPSRGAGSGSRRGPMAAATGGGTTMGRATLDVEAFADETANAVMVYGRPEDIDIIEKNVIDTLESAVSSHRSIATIPVHNASASAVASFIGQFLDESGVESARTGRAGGSTAGRRAQIIPNDNAKVLIVRGSRSEISEIQQLVEEFDQKELAQTQVKVIPVPLGQDATTLAREVERIVNEGERILADSTRRQARLVSIGADAYSNSIIVYGDPSTYGTVEAVVSQLGEVRPENVVTRVIQLTNLSSQDAQSLIEDLQRRRSGSGSSSGFNQGGFRPGGFNQGGFNQGGFNPGGGRQGGFNQGGFNPGGFNQGGGGRDSGSRTAPPAGGQQGGNRNTPRRPQGGGGGNRGGGSGGGGAMLWEHPAIPFDGPLSPSPAGLAFAEPVILLTAFEPFSGATGLIPALSSMMMQDAPRSRAASQPTTRPQRRPTREGAQSQPDRAAPTRAREETLPASRDRNRADRAARAASQPAPERRQRDADVQQPPREAPARRERQPAAETPPAVNQESPPQETPTSQPEVDLTAVSGSLRGDVIAAPIDSKRLIITGDADDVEFILQVLAMMESSAPRPRIEVFALKNAKATTLAEPLRQTVEAMIQQTTRSPGPADRFTISAEARSNSLIVAASEANMEIISGMIERLDVETETTGTQFATVPLTHVRAAEAAARLAPVIERLNRIREVPTEAQASIEANDRANSLLIIGTPKDIEEIRRLVEAYDVPIPEDEPTGFARAEMIIIGLQNGIAENVGQVLTDMIDAEQEAALTVQEGGRAGKPVARKLRLTLADGRVLPELDLERPIRILPEKGTNSLMIFSSPKNNEALKEIVGVFDRLPIGADVDVKAFALRFAHAEQVAELLRTTFEEAKRSLKRPAENQGSADFPEGVMPPTPPGVASRGLPYAVTVTFEARSNTVFVIGREDAVLLAAGLVKEIDKPNADLAMGVNVIQLRNIQATQLQEKLTDLLDKRAAALGSDNNTARDSAVIVPDDRSNSLVVVASPDMFAMISDVAGKLDQSDSYRAVDTRYRHLQYADAVKLASMLQELFTKKQEAADRTQTETKDVLSVLADDRSNSLMLTGTRDYLNEAEQLISNLDRAYDPTVEFRVRPVLLNSAANIATLLTDMIEKSRSAAEGNLSGTPIHVAADPLSNNLLIAASREDLIMLERWINVLDKPYEPGRVTRIIPVQRAKAEDLAKSAQDLYKPSGQGATADVTVTFDATTNSIIAVGPPVLIRDIENFVRSLDATEVKAGTNVRIFKLQQAAAEDAGNLLRSILEGRGGTVGGSRTTGGTSGGSADDLASQVMLIFQSQHPEVGAAALRAMRSEVRVIDDVRTNSLVITAPAESMSLMETLVTAIDVPPDAAKIRVFPLRNADAEQTVQMLEQLFGLDSSGRTTSTTGGGAGTTGEDQQLVLEGGVLGEGGRQKISFTFDARTNSVIAAGTAGYLDLAEQLILELDTKPIEDRKTFVYTPRNNEATSLATSIKEFSDAEQQRLQELGEDVSEARKREREIVAIANEDSNTLILGYTPRFESDVMDIVRELDQPPPQVMIQVLIVEVTMDNALDLGVEFAFQDLQFAKAGPSDTTTFDYVGGTDIGAAGTGLGGFTFTITGADFNFLFRTLQNEGTLNVLSRPQIVAMDNQEALIEITNDVPYVTGTSTSVAGQVTTQVARQDVGIILQVTPQINPDGFVRMEIKQEVSDLTDSTVDVGQGVTAPIFFKRNAETVVTVKDNETIVLGGLITSRDQRREQKVPLIGDIPLLGWLFRNTNTSHNRTELLVILTPRVIRTVEDYRELSVQERDRTGSMPDDVLTNPLMNGLQVKPEDLAPLEGEGMLGPFPREGQPAEEPPLDDEEYGPAPQRPAPPPPSEDDTYDIPITRRSG